jgi:hypothetical protein
LSEGLPAEERISICRMNLILKMAETEANQIAQTGAAIQASERLVHHEHMS